MQQIEEDPDQDGHDEMNRNESPAASNIERGGVSSPTGSGRHELNVYKTESNEDNKIENQEVVDNYHDHDPKFDDPVREDDGVLVVDSNNDDKDDDSSDKNNMPLFHYARLYGSLPRDRKQLPQKQQLSANVFKNECTCSTMGKLVITSETSIMTSEVNASSSPTTNDNDPIGNMSLENTGSNADGVNLDGTEQTGLWSNETLHIASLGFSDGSILLMDAINGLSAIAPSTKIGVESKKSSFLRVRDNNNTGSSGNTNNQPNTQANNCIPIAAVSFDSSGTSFGAIDDGGMCCIWTMKYKIQMRKIEPTEITVTAETSDSSRNSDQNAPLTTDRRGNHVTPLSNNQQPGGNIFTNFVSSKFNWQAPKPGQSNETPSVANAAPSSQQSLLIENRNQQSTVGVVPALTVADCKVHRVNYPRSFGKPTCLALDPAYSTKRETSLLVGFSDGRIAISKRGWLLQRREDKFIQYNSPSSSKDFKGIEAMVWRGSLVAFADCSGVRLYDIETLKPIAHIDRPSGARPSLYPSIPVLKPSLCFETSHSLLVSWGDCLLSMVIRESVVSVVTNTNREMLANDTNGDRGDNTTETGVHPSSSTSNTSSSAQSPNPTVSRIVQKKRVVECNMAWALDCIACGVAPIDEHHVVVLGLPMPSSDDTDDDDGSRVETSVVDETIQYCSKDELELQVISRANGNVVSFDLIPLSCRPRLLQAVTKNAASQGARLFQRLSSRSVAESESIDQQKSRLSSFFLLSSFAMPRMENSMELAEELKILASSAAVIGVEDVQTENAENFDFVYSNRDDRYANSAKSVFRDSHLKWNLRMINYDEEYEKSKASYIMVKNGSESRGDDEDTNSVDSDDYGFVYRDIDYSAVNRHPPPSPRMLIISSDDAILARTREIDDVIRYRIEQQNKAASALRLGIRHIQSIRLFTIDELVHRYLSSLLCVGVANEVVESKNIGTTDKGSKLSLRRLKLASEAMPILLGGKLRMWEFWLNELEKIPGALFVVQDYLPVRDPMLPSHVYTRVLTKMLDHIEAMKAKSSMEIEDSSSNFILEAEDLFLTALLCWGKCQALFEHIKLYKTQSVLDASFSVREQVLKEGLRRRETQSAATYLHLPIRKVAAAAHPTEDTLVPMQNSNASLYNVDLLFEIIVSRTSLSHEDEKQLAFVNPLPETSKDSRVVLDAAAKLCMMKGRYDDALTFFLAIGNRHSAFSVSDLEERALAAIRKEELHDYRSTKKMQAGYSYLLHYIDQHHLYQNLLVGPTSLDELNPPILSLMRLVGLDLVGTFLLRSSSLPASSGNTKIGNERRGTLPIDLVADQLSFSPKLLLWYLHSIFISKPELYVKFPNTANPPPEVVSLHKRHLELAIIYAGNSKDSSKVLDGVESYRAFETSTPLLLLLKEILQLGSIGPAEVGKMLQKERRGSGFSTNFALEVAYIMEHFGENTEANAKLILDLYLLGAKSVTLATSFTTRNQYYSETLWETLVDHCLKNVNQLQSEISASPSSLTDGKTYGALLEAAALCGADLAQLIARIPAGMQVEGLKPRLVAAVADYRLRVQLHSNSSRIAAKEKLLLLQEVSLRARKGMRCNAVNQADFNNLSIYTSQKAKKPVNSKSADAILRQSIERKHRAVLNYSLPIR